MTDEKIYNLLMSRDQAGLELLINSYGNLIKYIVKNTIKMTSEDVDECISDSLFTIWNRIITYNKEKSSLKSWIIIIVRSCSIDYYRKNKKHNQTKTIEDIDSKLVYKQKNNISNTNSIISNLQILPPPDNIIFYSKFILGEDVETIAEKLGISTESVYKRLSRGKKKYKELIKKENY